MSVRINYLRTMWRGETLQEFDELASQNNGMINAHLKHIQEGLIGYFPTINSLSGKNNVMRRAMHKPWYLPFKRFSARLMELNNYLPIFPGSSDIKKMSPEQINEILLHYVPNGW